MNLGQVCRDRVRHKIPPNSSLLLKNLKLFIRSAAAVAAVPAAAVTAVPAAAETEAS